MDTALLGRHFERQQIVTTARSYFGVSWEQGLSVKVRYKDLLVKNIIAKISDLDITFLMVCKIIIFFSMQFHSSRKMLKDRQFRLHVQ